MDGYVSKPVRVETLLAAVEGFFQAPCGAAAGDLPSTGPLDEASSSSVGRAPDAPTSLDEVRLVEAFGGNRVLLGEVIDAFLSDAPGRVREIRDGLARGDLDHVARTAHTLKGSAGLFQQPGVYDAARALEVAARAGQHDETRAALGTFELELAGLTTALQRIQLA
jgi:HPt (histidine-containing phosphotransfer) domain-containing protein